MKRIFTNGCFDLLHYGHIYLLEKAREMGDRLIVGVNSDESVKRLKGPSRPLVCLQDRMAILRSLRFVDEVVPFWEDTPERLIWAIRPDIIVKGSDWEGKFVAGQEIAEVRFIENVPAYSTTSMIRSIIASYDEGITAQSGESTGNHRERQYISE